MHNWWHIHIKVVGATILALRMPASTLLLPPKTSNKASLANNAHHIQIAKSIIFNGWTQYTAEWSDKAGRANSLVEKAFLAKSTHQPWPSTRDDLDNEIEGTSVMYL